MMMIQNQESRQSNTRLFSLLKKRQRKSLPKLSQPWPGRFTPNFVTLAFTKNEPKSTENNKIQKVVSTKFLEPISLVKGTSSHERMQLKPEEKKIISYFEVSQSASVCSLQSFKKSTFKIEKENCGTLKKGSRYMMYNKEYENTLEKKKWDLNEEKWQKIMQRKTKCKINFHK